MHVRADATDVATELAGAVDEGAAVVACFGLPYGCAPARTVNTTGLALGVPMLFGHVSGLVARIGPFVLPGATACLECTVLRSLAHAGAAETRVLQALRRSTTGVPPAAPVHPAFAQAAASLFALELSAIALALPASTTGAVVELVHGQAATARRTVRRVPTCPECHAPRPRRFGWDAAFPSPVLAEDG